MSNADDDPKQAARARAAAERKETEDLLAGFDRPGRTPRAPAVRQDFVDYFQKERVSAPPPRSLDAAPRPSPEPASAPSSDQRRAVETFVVPRWRPVVPAWLAWAALLIAMPAGGGIIAYGLIAHDGNAPSATGSPPRTIAVPSAATTISAATSPPLAASPPSPPSVSPSVSPSLQPAVSASMRPAATAPALAPAPAPAPSGSVDPRVDFIRNL